MSRLRQGDRSSIDVAAGEHAIRATVDGIGSRTLRVNVLAGQTIRMAVRPAGNTFQLWQVLLPHGYLRLDVLH